MATPINLNADNGTTIRLANGQTAAVLEGSGRLNHSAASNDSSWSIAA